MGTGCSLPSRQISPIRRRLSSARGSNDEWSDHHDERPGSAYSAGSMAFASSNMAILPNGLTLKDAHLLKKMWPSYSIEQTYEIGLEIFQLVFRLEPEVKEFFPSLNITEPTVSNGSRGEFQRTVVPFVRMLTLCVKYCDQPHELDDKLIELGRRHRQYAPHAQVKHFRVFEKAIAMVMRRRAEEQGKEEIEGALLAGYKCDTTAPMQQYQCHPSMPMDKLQQTGALHNPKEQVRATIAWTSLAAYIVREIMEGFNSVDEQRTDQKHKV